MSTLDTSKATPELFAALALAQADVESVGKDGTNTQRGYRYATTEAMIRGSRQHLASHGLAFFSTWSQALPEVAAGDIGKQHVAARVTIHWALGHSTGGQISGTAPMDAIGSPARPPDKAVAAAVTYGLGFLLRGLLLLDRADEDEHAPDRRQEPEEDPRWARLDAQTADLAKRRGITMGEAQALVGGEAGLSQRATDRDLPALMDAVARLFRESEPQESALADPTKAKPRGKAGTKPAEQPADTSGEDPKIVAARKRFQSSYRAYQEECKEQNLKPAAWQDMASEAIGRTWNATQGAQSADDYEKAARLCESAIDKMRTGEGE
jgi:hypothetical protein